MGDRARMYFDEAERLGGPVAKLRLASLAQVTSTEASSIEDTPDVMQRLDVAIRRVRAEAIAARKTPPAGLVSKGTIASEGTIGSEGTIAAPASSPSRPPPADVLTLRRHIATFVELTTQRALFLGDADAAIRRVNEAAATALDVERVSVWFLDAEGTKITCVDLYERGKSRHTGGMELHAADYAPYFAALRSERTIAAHDAHRDPRTAAFSLAYLRPLGIESMLDVPIWVKDTMVGVICHEHVGSQRTWNRDDESFAYLMSNFVGLALERGA